MCCVLLFVVGYLLLLLWCLMMADLCCVVFCLSAGARWLLFAVVVLSRWFAVVRCLLLFVWFC